MYKMRIYHLLFSLLISFCILPALNGHEHKDGINRAYDWNKEDDSIIFETRNDVDLQVSSCVGKWQSLPKSTMCMYHDNPARYDCGVTEEDKKIILDVHNRFRANVSPTQRNMMKMYWNDDLAAVAQKWANQCRRAHDTFENREIPGWSSSNLVGQSWAGGGLYSSWEKAITVGWHSEVKNFVYGSQWQNGVVGHYTQLVRDEANLIGCGKCMCTKEGIWDNPIYICNYYQGNKRDVGRPYMNGAPCQDCASGRCDNQGLCDCGDKVCKNNGTLNTRTCGCDCLDSWYGDDCGYFDCPAQDGINCGPGKFYDPSKCTIWANVPSICPHMCGLCDDPVPSPNPTIKPGECSDSDANCADWASQGECEKNPDFMLVNCKLSCKVCETGPAPSTPLPTIKPGECSDSHENCADWASQGECENNPDWMLVNCKLSCKVCETGPVPSTPLPSTLLPTTLLPSTPRPSTPLPSTPLPSTPLPTIKPGECSDSDANCAYWASQGECEKNPDFMLVNCKLSCDVCETGECSDSNVNCAYWASQGECENNPGFMLAHCKLSCNVCETGLCKDSHTGCREWAMSDECTRNPTWMSENCRKSCGMCN